jgi:hypothetical protein
MRRDVVFRAVLQEADWYTLRHSRVEEVEVEVLEGSNIRYRVVVWDEGREPFIRTFFNDPTPALDFAEKVKAENESHHSVRR